VKLFEPFLPCPRREQQCKGLSMFDKLNMQHYVRIERPLMAELLGAQQPGSHAGVPLQFRDADIMDAYNSVDFSSMQRLMIPYLLGICGLMILPDHITRLVSLASNSRYWLTCNILLYFILLYSLLCNLFPYPHRCCRTSSDTTKDCNHKNIKIMVWVCGTWQIII
jgi:hypothetical protein